MSDGVFEIYKDINSKFRFRLRAPNNKILVVSKGYASKKGCLQGVDALKRYALAEIRDLTIPTSQIKPLEDVSIEIRERAKTLGVASTTLHLDDPTPELPRVSRGTSVIFRGQLRSGEEGISDASIVICEHDRSFMNDDHIATGITGHDGTFEIHWKAKPMDWWDDSVEVYARYEGSKTYLPARSKIYSFHVS